MGGKKQSVMDRLRKIVRGLLFSSCMCGLNALGCTMSGEQACDAVGMDCSDQTLNLDADAAYPLKTVAIS